jgi:4-hydroxy-2-oxoheptanedioate aldolase
LRKNAVKKALKEGKVCIGTFVKMSDPSSVEILGLAGFDFFVLDNEHVAMNREAVTNLLRASDISGIVPIVRVRENTPVEIMQALDAGALGVQVPNVDTYEEAKLAVESFKYAPKGSRGFAPTHRAAAYGFMDKLEYIRMANEEILTIIHCETMKSFENLDKILKLEELDVVFIGPMDLSQSLGADIIGRDNHPRLLEVIDSIIEKVTRAGKTVGTVASSPEAAKKLVEKGVKYIPVSSDQGMIGQVAKKIISELKKQG